jgi:hypothetical protein
MARVFCFVTRIGACGGVVKTPIWLIGLADRTALGAKLGAYGPAARWIRTLNLAPWPFREAAKVDYFYFLFDRSADGLEWENGRKCLNLPG